MDKIFEQNPSLKAYYGTSDGQAFYNQNSAANHAKTLSDKTVTHHERPLTDPEGSELERLPEMTLPEMKVFALTKGFTVTKTRKPDVLAEITEQLIAEMEDEQLDQESNQQIDPQ